MTNIIYRRNRVKLNNQNGFSLPELIVVLLIISIIVVLALPQIISSRRLFRFSGFQRQLSTSLNEARQEAMSQRKAVTFRYDNVNKRIIIYGGDFGALNDSKNKVFEVSGAGVEPADVVYGRPSGVPAASLSDTTNLTNLAANMLDITFQADGSVLDASNNPKNTALFFYHNKSRLETAFAISILGAGGRTKIWRYSRGVNAYVE